MTIASDHLRACSEHRVVADHVPPNRDGRRYCPVCETDAEARPDAVDGKSFRDVDMRWQIHPDTMDELIPLLVDAADDHDIGPVWVAVAELPRDEVRNAAGWTEQERWFNIVGVDLGHDSRELIIQEKGAQDALELLRDGEKYLDPATVDTDALNPDNWQGVADYYCESVEYERVDDTTLHIQMEGFPSDNAYSSARQELGQLADMQNLHIQTLEAGGRFSPATVAVSAAGDDGE